MDYFFADIIGINRLPLVVLGKKILGLISSQLFSWLIILVLELVRFLLILKLLVTLLEQIFIYK